ncbi:YdaS family helix-turn-helix protein [Escherichia coli]|nr:YdaS family helix-turn-helix protein [Escherichia coli]
MNQSEIAKHLGVKSQAVSGWLNFTGVIPADRVIPLSRVLDWQVTPTNFALTFIPTQQMDYLVEISVCRMNHWR